MSRKDFQLSTMAINIPNILNSEDAKTIRAKNISLQFL